MIIKAIAIDDEPIALDIIKSFAARIPGMKLSACFNSAIAAADYLRQHQVQLIFLDIKMPGLSGIDFLHNLPNKPIIIMTTAYSEYAVQSFELEVCDYLLKPFSYERFVKACNKALRHCESAAPKDAGKGSLFLKSGYKLTKVALQDILYIESVGNYMHFNLSDQTVVCRATMTEALELLPAKGFIRVHRSFIVAIGHVIKLETNGIWLNNKLIPVGDSYKHHLISLIATP